MSGKLQKSLSLDQEIWERIDEKRGDVSRSRFVARLLAESLGTSKKDGEQSKQVQQPIEEKLQ